MDAQSENPIERIGVVSGEDDSIWEKGSELSVVLQYQGESRGEWCGTLLTKSTEEYRRSKTMPSVPQRFINAEKGDEEKGKERWKETLEWRVKVGANMFLRQPHPHFDVVKKAYPHYIHGRDLQGRVVYIERLGQIDLPYLKEQGVNIEHLLQHYMFVSEFMWEYVSPDDMSQGLTILDLEGVGVGDLTGEVYSFLREANHFYGKHFPEKAGDILVINASFFFSSILSMVKPFIDPVTASKIHHVRPKDTLEELKKFMSMDMIPQEFGGNCPFTLGHSQEETMLRNLVDTLNKRDA